MNINIFFTSDTHFGHANIIKYCKRPFSDVNEMDKTIINNWNSVVGKNDLVYHLGDFCTWKSKEFPGQTYQQAVSRYTRQLNGKIFLIEGNHDKKIRKIATPLVGIKGVSPLLILKQKSHNITLCHYAMRVWNKSHFNSWHLYGHSHGMLPSIGKSMDVGVDCNEFRPIHIDEIESIMNKKPYNENWVGRLLGFHPGDFEEARKCQNQE